MTKKILALVLALVLCLGITTFTASADDEPYELVVLRYGSVGSTDMQAGLGDVQEAMNAWLANNGYNFTVDMMHVVDGSQIELQIAAKDHIDIFWQNAGSRADRLIAANFMYDLGDIYKNYEGLYNSIPEGIWATLLRNGGKSLYQIPCYKESGISTALIVKKGDAEKYGMEEIINAEPGRIWDLAEFTPYLEQAAEDFEQPFLFSGFPLVQGARDYIGMDEFAAINEYIAIDLSGDTTKAQLITEIPAYQEYCDLVASWNDAGYIEEGILTGTASNDRTWLFRGETLTPDMQANMDARYAKYDETGIYYMMLDKNYLGSNSALGSGYAITSYCPEVDKAMQFFDAIYGNTEAADLYLYGIEGTHYNRLEDGSCEKIADSGYDFAAWATSNVMTVSLQSTDSANKKEAYAEFNDAAIPSILLGFVLDRTNIDAELNACAGVVAEYQKPVETGFNGEEAYVEYGEALKAAGAETVLAEVQAQLDAFFAAK